MIKVNNKRAIRNLSQKSLRANKARNMVAILAITLTTLMFTAFFTIVGSMIGTMQNQTMRQIGTRAHAGFKLLTQKQFETLKQDPKIKDISYDIIVGFGENEELSKTPVEIRWTEEKDAKWSFCEPTTGRLPEKGREIATSTQVLDALGISHELGEKVPISFTANGIRYDEIFTLCGFWDMDIILGVNEAFVSREYCDKVAPIHTIPFYEQPDADRSYMAGGINPSIWFANSWNIEKQVEQLRERCAFDKRVNDGVNWAYQTSTIDAQIVIIAIMLILLIFLSGYLIIYNIFLISVSRDIHYYGLLKTIGTTGKQIRTLVQKQALYLCIMGTPIGILTGYLIGCCLMPVVMNNTSFKEFYIIERNPIIFFLATIFSVTTVWISCIRPGKIAGKVTPIEAIRYTGMEYSRKKKTKKTRRNSSFTMAFSSIGREKKKMAVVLVSLSLSLLLLNGTYMMVTGFDMDTYLAYKTVADFMVSDNSIFSSVSASPELEGISKDTLEEIEKLPGVEEIGNVYLTINTQKLVGQVYERAKEIVEKNRELLPSPYADENIRMLEEDQLLGCNITGIDEMLYDKLELAEGMKFDKEKFNSGEYVIATAFFSSGEDPYYGVGDKVSIDFGNGKQKEYTVLAIGDVPYVLGPRFSGYLDCNFVLPSSEYLKQIQSDGALYTTYNVDEIYTDEIESWTKDYCTNVHAELNYESKKTYEEQFHSVLIMYQVVGGALSLILGLIGLLNYTNTMVTSIDARRIELATLQSIGMTGKQLRRMLIWEGLLYAGGTIVLTMTVGGLLVYLAIDEIAKGMWAFKLRFSMLPVVCYIPFLVILAMLIPCILYSNMVKRSVVERLQETE